MKFKTIIQNIIIASIIISILLSLPFIVKQRDFKTYSDKELRNFALKKGIRPIPSSYEELKKIYNTKNIINEKKVQLGKKLFFDTTLSKNNNTSCATCHLISKNPKNKKIITKALITKEMSKDIKNANNCVICHLGDQSGTDRLATSIGTNGNQHPFHLNTQSILNSSLAKFFTWSGEIHSLEKEVEKSIELSYKLDMDKNTLVEKLKNNKEYENMNLTFKDIRNSIATYIRTLLTRSSFDEFLEGDNNAISSKAKEGLTNFINFGCSGCHAGMSLGGQSVQRFPLRHIAGIHELKPNVDTNFNIIDKTFPFENKGGFKGRANTNFFRVPILRNVTKTSPYFHNGAIDKISKAVEIMGRHQVGLKLNNKQINEIVAFLKTLEGNIVDYSSKKDKK